MNRPRLFKRLAIKVKVIIAYWRCNRFGCWTPLSQIVQRGLFGHPSKLVRSAKYVVMRG